MESEQLLLLRRCDGSALVGLLFDVTDVLPSALDRQICHHGGDWRGRTDGVHGPVHREKQARVEALQELDAEFPVLLLLDGKVRRDGGRYLRVNGIAQLLERNRSRVSCLTNGLQFLHLHGDSPA